MLPMNSSTMFCVCARQFELESLRWQPYAIWTRVHTNNLTLQSHIIPVIHITSGLPWLWPVVMTRRSIPWVTSHGSHTVSKHDRLGGLFNSLFRFTTKETFKLCVPGPLWQETSDGRIIWFWTPYIVVSLAPDIRENVYPARVYCPFNKIIRLGPFSCSKRCDDEIVVNVYAW